MMCTRVCDSLKISYYCSPKLARVLLLKHKCCAACPVCCHAATIAVTAARKDDGGAINLPLDGGCLLEWNLVVCVDMSIVIE